MPVAVLDGEEVTIRLTVVPVVAEVAVVVVLVDADAAAAGIHQREFGVWQVRCEGENVNGVLVGEDDDDDESLKMATRTAKRKIIRTKRQQSVIPGEPS